MNVIAVSGVLALILATSVIMVHSNSLEESMVRLKESMVKLEGTSKEFQNLRRSMLEKEEFRCILMTDVDRNLVQEAKVNGTVPADNRAYKEYLSCLWQQLGYQDEDGYLQWYNIRAVLDNEYPTKVVDGMVQRCNSIQGITAGDTVGLVLRCLDDNGFVLSKRRA